MIEILDFNTESKRKTSVALGYFDGLHLGHQKVILSAKKAAGLTLCPTVFTFSYIPQTKVLKEDGEKGLDLTSFDDKRNLLENYGIKQFYIDDFLTVMELSPEQFVKHILVDILKAKKVFCGQNYRFGLEAKGDIDELKRLCKQNNIKVFVVDTVNFNGAPISSTRIRECLKNGDVVSAKEMLGRWFSFDFEVIQGKRLASTLGTPTLNQVFPEKCIMPKFGVYASVSYVDGKKYFSVTNIGDNPTFDKEIPKAETWIPNYNGRQLYGNNIRVELRKYIREQQKFDSLEELKSAIIRDAKISENIVKSV